MKRKEKAQITEIILGIIVFIALIQFAGSTVGPFLVLAIILLVGLIVFSGIKLLKRTNNRIMFFIPHIIISIVFITSGLLVEFTSDSRGWMFVIFMIVLIIILLLSIPPLFIFEEKE